MEFPIICKDNSIIVEESCDEGFLFEEAKGNEYCKIKKKEIVNFPNLLVGQILTSFDIPLTKTKMQGVGILIGPNIVLTAGHILCQKMRNNKNGMKIYKASEVIFCPASSENFIPIKKILCSNNFYINEKYIDILCERHNINNNNNNEKYKNDWGLIFLPYDVENYMKILFDVDEKVNQKLQVKNGIFQFFLDSISNLDQVNSQNDSNKEISLLAYIELDSEPNFDSHESNSENDIEIFETVMPSQEYISLRSNSQTSIPFSESRFYQDYFKFNVRVSQVKDPVKSDDKRFLKKKKNDFVLLDEENNKDPNNHFEYNTKSSLLKNHEYSSKMTMCEAKGFIYFPNGGTEKENFLYYQFHTLKGQSGAPIFLRVKSPNETNYNYYLLGIHLRKGPSHPTRFRDSTDFDYEIDSTASLDPNSYSHLFETNDQMNQINCCLNNNLSNNANINYNLQHTFERKIEKIDGDCEYNIGLRITDLIMNSIINVLKSHMYKTSLKTQMNLSFSFETNYSEQNFLSDYVLIKLYFNNSLKVKGLFNKSCELLSLFQISAKLLNAKKKFITLDLRSSDDIKYRAYHKKIYNFDKNTRLEELTCEKTHVNGSSYFKKIEYCIIFDIGLNLSLLSDSYAERILNKVAQNNKIDKFILKKYPLQFRTYLTVAIFSEIEKYNNFYPEFGSLFKIIQVKLGLIN